MRYVLKQSNNTYFAPASFFIPPKRNNSAGFWRIAKSITPVLVQRTLEYASLRASLFTCATTKCKNLYVFD